MTGFGLIEQILPYAAFAWSLAHAVCDATSNWMHLNGRSFVTLFFFSPIAMQSNDDIIFYLHLFSPFVSHVIKTFFRFVSHCFVSNWLFVWWIWFSAMCHYSYGFLKRRATFPASRFAPLKWWSQTQRILAYHFIIMFQVCDWQNIRDNFFLKFVRLCRILWIFFLSTFEEICANFQTIG